MKQAIGHFLTFVLVWLLLGHAPAAALEAKIRVRTAFCHEAKINCQAAFYLTPADRIRIEGQSADGKWLKLRHLESDQTGWVLTADIQLQAANRLQSEVVMTLAKPALALTVTPQGLALIESERMLPVQSKVVEHELKGIDTLKPDQLRVFMSAAMELKVYGEIEVEKQRFLQEVQPALQDYPRFRTLLHLAEGPHAVAMLPEQILLLMGSSDAGWGHTQLVGLDSQYLPVMMLRQNPEIQNFLPIEVRSGLRGESIKLQDLEPDGTLTVSAFHNGIRRDVLVRVTPHPTGSWDFQGQYFWPKDLPFRPDVAGLRLRLWHEGEETFLLVSTEATGPGWLIFYAGGSEPLTIQKLEIPIIDAVLYQGQFWTLETTTITRWQPVEDVKPETDKTE